MIGSGLSGFNAATGEFTLALGSVTYEAPGGLKVPRGLWGYGIRQTKMVQSKPPAVFSSAKIHTGTTNEVALVIAIAPVSRSTPSRCNPPTGNVALCGSNW